jgi:tRNA(Arg) A34 adenosine deaminase TadA
MSYTDVLISRALRVAAESQHAKWHHGAILVRGSTVLASSPNKVRTTPHPGFWRSSTFHAEEAALRRLRSHHRQPDTIVVARLSKGGVPRLARPCEGCWRLIVAAGITNIFYTLDDAGYGYEKVVPFVETTFR